MRQARVSIFNGNLEIINLLLPAFFLMAALIEISVSGPLFSKVSGFFAMILTNAIFFNTTHILLTYYMIKKVPAFKAIVLGRAEIAFQSVLIFVVCFVLFYFVNMKVDAGLTAIVTLMLILLPTQHAIWQIKGLSLLYNKNIKLQKTPSVARKIEVSEAFEKWGFRVFFTFLIARIVFENKSLLAGAAVGFLMIFAGAFMYPQVLRSNKLFFLSRIAAFLLSPFSFFAALSQSLAHGVEYLFMFEKVGSKAFTGKQKLAFLLFGLFGLLIYGIIYTWMAVLEIPFAKTTVPHPVWLAVVQAALGALGFLHYYLDRMIFRMRDPEVRSQIAPLLGA